jgi:hypothetical protein
MKSLSNGIIVVAFSLPLAYKFGHKNVSSLMIPTSGHKHFKKNLRWSIEGGQKLMMSHNFDSGLICIEKYFKLNSCIWELILN